MQEQAKLLEKQICPYCRNAYRPDWERMGFPNGRRKRKPRQTGGTGRGFYGSYGGTFFGVTW
jgi:hypothetical protein